MKNAKLFAKLNREFLEKYAFIICMGMMLSHVINTYVLAATGLKVYMIFYGVFGVLAVLLAVLSVIFEVAGRRGQKAEDGSKEESRLKMPVGIKPWDICLAAMLAWAVISTILSPERELAFFGTDSRNDGLYTYFIYAAFYTLARMISDERRRVWLMRGLSLMVSAMSLISIPQWIFGVPGLEQGMVPFASGLNNINHFAYLLAMGIVAACGLVFTEKSFLWKMVAYLSAGVSMWALIVNFTMGSYLAVLVGFPFLIFLMFRRCPDKWREAIAICLLILFVNLLMNVFTDMISQNFEISMRGIEFGEEGIVLTDSAGTSRLGLWRQAFVYIAERPVFGFGPEGLFYRYYEDGFSNDRPHNEYIQHAVFLGIPALLMYLGALVSLL